MQHTKQALLLLCTFPGTLSWTTQTSFSSQNVKPSSFAFHGRSTFLLLLPLCQPSCLCILMPSFQSMKHVWGPRQIHGGDWAFTHPHILTSGPHSYGWAVSLLPTTRPCSNAGHSLILTFSRQVPIHKAGQFSIYPLQGLVQRLGINSSSHPHTRSPFIRLGSLAFTHYKALFKGWAV